MNENSTTTGLPELSDTAIDRMEKEIFAELDPREDTRPAPETPSTRARARRRRWMTGIGVAAAFVAGILVTPGLLTATGSLSAMQGTVSVDAPAPQGDAGSESAVEGMPQDASAQKSSALATGGDRDVITTAGATIEVTTIVDAVDGLRDLAKKHDGLVESTDIARPVPGAVDDSTPSGLPQSPLDGYAWVTLRVPSEQLTAVVDALDALGTVTQSSVSQFDVTRDAVDLRARVEALETSVKRLKDLMTQSGSVSDLIEAETALSDRQAELDAATQELQRLENQVEMSTLSVEVVRKPAPADANPGGFTEGIEAGWNGLIVSLNAIVIALGFALPWLAVLAVIVLAVWLIRRRRHPRGPRAAEEE